MKGRIGAAVAAMLTVSGCLGGSSGGTSDFTSVSEIDGNGTTVISGRSVDTPFVGSPVLGTANPGTPNAQSSAELRLEFANDEIVGARFAAGGRTLVDADSQDDITVADGIIAGEGSDGAFIILDPEAVGFEYQSFGVWFEGDGLTSSGGRVGVLTVGSRTPGGDLPSGGPATYTGGSIGWVALPGEALKSAGAEVTLTTEDYRTVVFKTQNTFVDDILTDQSVFDARLNLDGELRVTGSGFSGVVTSDLTSGNLNGTFYGPNAEEAGGLFVTTGSDGAFYKGSFGATR